MVGIFKELTPVCKLMSNPTEVQGPTAEGLYSAVYETANNRGSVLL